METKRKVEIFTAGCPACDETVRMVKRMACDSCEVTIRNMQDADVAQRAGELGIRTVPAVVVDGELAGCCVGSGPSEATLRAMGIGRAA